MARAWRTMNRRRRRAADPKVFIPRLLRRVSREAQAAASAIGDAPRSFEDLGEALRLMAKSAVYRGLAEMMTGPRP
jgi:hypothetical protein